MLSVKHIQNYDCDVLIAGGGPAGSSLAFHLAKKGFKVIVVESETFPRDKVCGDGVSPIALLELNKLGITETAKFRKTNEIKQVGLFIKNDKVSIPLSKPDHLPFHAHIIPRMELDHWISDAAKNAGAKFIEGTRVVAYKIKSNVAIATLKQGQIQYRLKAKMIVGADGSSSKISRQLNGKKPREEFQLLGLRAYYENVNSPTDQVNIYFTEESFPGICWMFPNGEKGANIGMAMVAETFPDKNLRIKELLIQHINNNKDIKDSIGDGKMVGKILGWPITFYDSNSLLCSERIVLVGDAAGLINPLSGDGIQYALLSASWASAVISKSIVNDDFSESALSAYKMKVENELGYDFALSNLLVQFPRNKSLSKVWMTILEILIAQAKKDKGYADIIAGIFEGTYPSYKAFTIPFILKSLKQGGMTLKDEWTEYIKNPEGVVDKLLKNSHDVASLVSELSTHQEDNIAWVKKTAGKTISLAGQMVRHWVKEREQRPE